MTIRLVGKVCARCRRGWADTPLAARRGNDCPYCGARNAGQRTVVRRLLARAIERQAAA